MIRRFFALVGFLFLCVSHANAQSIPPTYTTADPVPGSRVQVSSSWYSSAQAACSYEVWGVATTPVKVGNIGAGQDQYRCQRNSDGLVYPNPLMTTEMICTSGTLAGNQCVGVPSCPTDYKLEGTMCVPDLCPVGYERDASGQCVKDCTAKRGMALPNTHYRVGESGTGALGGCKFHCDTRVKFAIAVFGDLDNPPQEEWISTGCRYTGQAADNGDYNAEGTGSDVPPPDKPTKPDDCMAQGMGYIQSSSGQTNCVPSSSAPPAQRPDEVRHDREKESGKPGSNGAPDPNAPGYMQQKESHISKGGDIISQKEERIRQPGYDQGSPQPCPDGYVSDGQGFCVKSSAERQKEQDFCRERPNEPICKTINDGAANKDKPTTDGKTCKEGDTSAACAKLDSPGDGGAIQERTIDVTGIATVAVASNASCPQGPQLPKGLGQFPMDGVCMYASGLRPIILALAWLSAGLIVLGAFRE